jgi:hypothetical protein
MLNHSDTLWHGRCLRVYPKWKRGIVTPEDQIVSQNNKEKEQKPTVEAVVYLRHYKNYRYGQ